ncbi:hypothetical protein BTA51_06375 [Hahella sp. CCB-MM4]|uniref:hypothetical protein n=1 Tax=Hahella sp. (strain CCB-MM4) TaxID=1926491 RepID=UPI000B9A5E50|nr:hypothetical protein [Hahella sp. CCB-MM4]OZG74615.1 hypothetical protein BTA51_06375 [Hahella sp. CCB-MM4]
MAQYELVFSGQLIDGFDLAQVKQNVANLFKASPAQVEQMFSGRSVVLRNRLDEATANKYLAILKKNGARCELRMMGQPAPAEASAAAKPAPSPQPPSQAVPSAEARPPAKEGGKGVQTPPGALPVAGEKVDTILQDVSWDVAPAGTQLAEEADDLPTVEPDTSHLSLAPAGSDMGQKKAPAPPPAPDTSHLKLDN